MQSVDVKAVVSWREKLLVPAPWRDCSHEGISKPGLSRKARGLMYRDFDSQHQQFYSDDFDDPPMTWLAVERPALLSGCLRGW